jgi:hypothetical protein
MAPVAGVRAARKASPASGGGLELLAAAVTVTKDTAVGEARPRRIEQVADLFPDRVVGGGVARSAEREQIVEAVGLLVAGEQSKRADVVHREPFGDATASASMAVAFERGRTLTLPVRAAISGVATTPGWVQCSGHARHTQSIQGVAQWT